MVIVLVEIGVWPGKGRGGLHDRILRGATKITEVSWKNVFAIYH